MTGDVLPHYLSTACYHELHGECRRTCKWCGAVCECEVCRHGDSEQ